ncbi:MAG: ATP-binding protein [Candidatus Sumerlaeia bacterium]
MNNLARVRQYTFWLVIGWTLVLLMSMAINVYETKKETLAIARNKSRIACDKDVFYRHWNSAHGGVYAVVSPLAQPNPYLKVENRDLVTQNGINLTMINPAYMTRQVHELERDKGHIYSHITSLNPIRPNNAPTDWERRALMAFEKGEKEFSEFGRMQDKLYFRFMQPLYVEESCLKCHAEQGYKVGEVRGGISNSIPMAPLLEIQNHHIVVNALTHAVLWMLGFVGIRTGGERIRSRMVERDIAENQLQRYHSVLSVARQIDQMLVNCRKRDQLAQNVCDAMIQVDHFEMAWMLLMDKDQKTLSAAHAGEEKYQKSIHDHLSHGQIPPCTRECLNQGAGSVMESSGTVCRDCILKNLDDRVYLTCLARGETKYGVLAISVADRQKLDENEKRLFTEIASDIAFALFSLEREAERRAFTEELKQTNEKLQEANQHKNMFLSSMSHELRTPLNGIMGFANLLDEPYSENLNDKQKRFVQLISQSGKHLLDLINDLLDMARIDSGGLDVNREQIEVGSWLQSTLHMIRTEIEKKDLQLEVNIEEEIPTVFADKRRGRQILINLVSNAIKYSPAGAHLWVSAEKTDDDMVRISVRDEGIGIEEEAQDKIFSEFYQANRLRDEKLGGTGIGLALTKRLVEMHGGQIGVQSEEGVGSLFWFTLPLYYPGIENASDQPQATEKPDQKTPEAEISPMRILVAEDNPVNMILIEEMLLTANHEVLKAEDGKEACEIAIREKPDLILMDIRMPEMNGIEALQELRLSPDFPNSIPVIALTASAGPHARQVCLDAGFTDYLSKPIEVDELDRVLRQCK